MNNFYYNKNKRHSSRQRNTKEKKEKKKKEFTKEFKNVLEKIKNLDRWSLLTVEEISKIDGYAYIVAKSIIETENSQLRKYYDEALKGYRILSRNSENKEKDLQEALTILSMLMPRVFYARAKSSPISDEFFAFLKNATNLDLFSVDNIESFKEDYERYIQFFEAVVGYHRYLKEIGGSEQNE